MRPLRKLKKKITRECELFWKKKKIINEHDTKIFNMSFNCQNWRMTSQTTVAYTHWIMHRLRAKYSIKLLYDLGPIFQFYGMHKLFFVPLTICI